MTYVINRFGPVYATAENLPVGAGEQPSGSADTASTLVALAGGGVFDVLGSEWAWPRPRQIPVKGIWATATAGAMEAKVAALNALRGTRSKLWRSNGSLEHWCVARCLEVIKPLGRSISTVGEITVVFETPPGPWWGAAHDDLTVLDTSPKTIPITNGGNVRVTNAILTLTAGAVSITEVKVGVSGVSEIKWTGTLASGVALVIDCGARSVKKGGVDAYSGFSLTANHKIDDWLRLEAGNNSVLVTLTGGSTDSTLRIQFSDGWA